MRMKMKKILKFIFPLCLLIISLMLLTACSEDLSPFESLNQNGYTVSIKFDANGGTFTTNTETIIDTYKLSEFKANSEGEVELRLFAPDDAARGNQAYTATKDNFFLAGWYTERTEIKNDADEVTGYTYGGRWDFENDRYAFDPAPTYSSDTPVITLYAAWVPAFTYEFYTVDGEGTQKLAGSLEINPLSDTTLTLPADDPVSGRVNAPNDFPEIEGMTYDKIYLDPELGNQITDKEITHSGKFVPENATLENPTMKLYCFMASGISYNITSAEQLIASPDLAATYTILEDLDFSGLAWPAIFTSGDFSGVFIGNGHTIKNVTVTQNNTANTGFGLFGRLSETSAVTDITFENIKVNIKGYSNQQNAAFGIIAGEIADGAAVSGITLRDSVLALDNSTALMVAVNSRSPKFGLVCAVGNPTGITFSKENVKAELSSAGAGAGSYDFEPNELGQFTLTIVNE